MKKDPFDITPSLRSKPSDFESQLYPLQDKPEHSVPAVPTHAHTGSATVGKRDANGMAEDQNAALAGLDPRPKNIDLDGQRQSLGTTTHAVSGIEVNTPPEEGISVNRDYKLEESRGIAI